ncbi:MAG: precorrin-2 dehydrogenase/sirohydrochlorin ferrochelatase family protein [Terriglobales bacterium]
MARLFPIFVKLYDRPVLVVGAGTIAEQKIRGLLETGARIRVVALQAGAVVHEWAEAGRIMLEERAFSPTDLEGRFLVIAATASSEANQSIFVEARGRGVLCNVVDVPEQCDFFYPAVVQRGDLQIAISTAGQSPSLAQRLRQQLERQFGPGYEEWVARLGETRREVLDSRLSPERKRCLLRALASREAFEAALARQIQAGEKAS